jgi:hypothetical protein
MWHTFLAYLVFRLFHSRLSLLYLLALHCTLYSPLPHSLYNHDGVDICLICKDPQTTTQEWLDKEPVSGVKEVLGVMKLRKNYHQFEDKRELCDRFQLFLADERVLPLLPPLLGKYFFARKKQPIAVKIGCKVSLVARDLAVFLCFHPVVYFVAD